MKLIEFEEERQKSIKSNKNDDYFDEIERGNATITAEEIE